MKTNMWSVYYSMAIYVKFGFNKVSGFRECIEHFPLGTF